MDSAEDHKPPVLILAYVYPPDNYSGAARPYRFAKYLARLGHPVEVIAAGAGDGVQVAGPVYRVRGELGEQRKTLLDKLVRAVWLQYDEGLTWVPRAVRLAKRWSSRRPVLLSTSPPLTTHLAALWLKRRYGWKWVADFRDPLVGNPFRELRRVRYTDGVLERCFFRHADALIANTDAMAAFWRRLHPSYEHKITLLWNSFDAEEPIGPAPLPPRNFRVLAHVGTIYGNRHPGLVLAAVARLIAKGRLDPAKLRIQLVGPMEARACLANAVAERLAQEGCLELNPRLVPRTEAQSCAAEADLLLLLDVVSGAAGLQVPGKLFDYIRIGRPILASTTRDSPVERILQQCGVAHRCIYPDLAETELDQRVLEFLELPTEATSPAPWFQERFDAARQARDLSGLIAALAMPGGRRG